MNIRKNKWNRFFIKRSEIHQTQSKFTSEFKKNTLLKNKSPTLQNIVNNWRCCFDYILYFTFSDWSRFPVYDDLLDYEAHAGKPLAAGRVLPHGLFIDLVHSEERSRHSS